MSELDLNPLQSEIAALRYEVRAQTFAIKAAAESDWGRRELAFGQMLEAQANADRVGHHYRVILGAKAEAPA